MPSSDELWYAENHPFEFGVGWTGCVDCGKAELDQIHDDPRAGQDFDWKWGDPA